MSVNEPLTGPARAFLSHNRSAQCWNPARGLGGCGAPSLEQAVLHPCRWRVCPGRLQIGTRAAQQVRTLAWWIGVTVSIDPCDFELSEPLTLCTVRAAERRFAARDGEDDPGLRLYHFADRGGSSVAIFERYDGVALRLFRYDHLFGLMSAQTYPTAEAAASGEAATGYRYRPEADNASLDAVMRWFLSRAATEPVLARMGAP